MKSTVVFKYDRKKDVYNYLNSVYKFSWLHHGREVDDWVVRFLFSEDLEKIKTAKNEDTAQLIIKRIVEKIVRRSEYEFSKTKNSLEETWFQKEKLYFKKLGLFYNKPIFFPNVTAFMTTLPICPYSLKERWFMVSYRFCLEEQIRTVCHELMHFMFLYYYGNSALVKLGSKEKVEVLKEALTVFLNTDFKGIIPVPDRGYPQEKQLRDFLLQERKGKQSFIALMDAGIEYLKREA